LLLRVDVTKEFVTCETVFQFTTGDEMIFVHRSPKRCKIDGEEEEEKEEEQKFATNGSERESERGSKREEDAAGLRSSHPTTLGLLGFFVFVSNLSSNFTKPSSIEGQFEP
jgi:hypothetical protein